MAARGPPAAAASPRIAPPCRLERPAGGSSHDEAVVLKLDRSPSARLNPLKAHGLMKHARWPLGAPPASRSATITKMRALRPASCMTQQRPTLPPYWAGWSLAICHPQRDGCRARRQALTVLFGCPRCKASKSHERCRRASGWRSLPPSSPPPQEVHFLRRGLSSQSRLPSSHRPTSSRCVCTNRIGRGSASASFLPG
jgi:hypothetical protein